MQSPMIKSGTVLAALLLASPVSAAPTYAQFMVNGAGAGVTYQGEGDAVSGWQNWGGLRAFTAAIAAAGTQKLVKVTASGTTPANVTCDVFVNTVYDQAGSVNMVNASPSTQPLLLFTGCTGTAPACMTFASASNQVLTGTMPITGQPFTLEGVASRTANPTTSQTVFGNVNVVQLGFINVASHAFLYAGGTLGTTASATDSVVHAMNGTLAGASSILNVDGTETATVEAATGIVATASGSSLGSNGSAGNLLTGQFYEWGVLTATASTPIRNAACHNASVAWGMGAC